MDTTIRNFQILKPSPKLCLLFGNYNGDYATIGAYSRRFQQLQPPKRRL